MVLRIPKSTGIPVVAALAFASLVVAPLTGCDSEADESEESESRAASDDVSEPAPDDEESSGDQPDADSERDTGDASWKAQIKKAMKSAPDSGATGEQGNGGGCTLFPDSCGQGESCFVVGDNQKRCGSYDASAEVGTTCRRADDCNAGQQCVGGRPGTCRIGCKPGSNKWGCGDDAACEPVVENGERLSWGVCRSKGDACETWPDDSCGMGEACVNTDLGFRCRDVPFATDWGASCPDGSVDCSVDQGCVRIEGGDQECRPKCDDEHPCERGECVPLDGRPWGFCAESG